MERTTASSRPWRLRLSEPENALRPPPQVRAGATQGTQICTHLAGSQQQLHPVLLRDLELPVVEQYTTSAVPMAAARWAVPRLDTNQAGLEQQKRVSEVHRDRDQVSNGIRDTRRPNFCLSTPAAERSHLRLLFRDGLQRGR